MIRKQAASTTDQPLNLRRHMRQKRAALSLQQRTSAAKKISTQLWKQPIVQRANRIAIYMAVRGEVDCTPVINQGWLRKKRIFAPILAQNRLFFVPLKRDTCLTQNRFQIPEPQYSVAQILRPQQLDVVIMPLTAFDDRGNRLGMGAGYYDRTFAFRRRRGNWRKPLLIGVAYSFQQVGQLHAQSWDVPMDRIITDSGVIQPQHKTAY